MTSRRMRGFSLIEVLVALVVITFGLLGMAALQGTTLGTTTGARNETQVAMEAESMADAIAANSGYWAAGLFPTNTLITVTGNNAGATLSDSTLNASTRNCETNSCTPVQMASYDLKQWGADLHQQIPGATGSIRCNVGTPNTCTITIQWTMKTVGGVNAGARIASNPPGSQTYTLVTAL